MGALGSEQKTHKLRSPMLPKITERMEKARDAFHTESSVTLLYPMQEALASEKL
jgi:hypothetical protein